MIVEIKVPSPGESISEVEIASWAVEDGAFVEKDQEIAEIESDKATLPLIAEAAGKISLKAEAGDTVEVGQVICTIDSSATNDSPPLPASEKTEEKPQKETPQEDTDKSSEIESHKVKATPVAKKMMEAHQFSVEDIIAGLRKITKQDVEAVANLPKDAPQKQANNAAPAAEITGLESDEKSRETETKKMSQLRRKLSQRLVAVKNETAMLTTFNEVDMSAIMALRKKRQKQFVDTHGFKVGFMSFFLKAAAQALLLYPEINAMLDNDSIVYHKYCDIGIAVQSPKGLMVPVIRNVEALSLAAIEGQIKKYAQKAQQNRVAIDDMTGGTFTITNGGTFGSLMSTPIINPPQSAILGMHNILERPVAIEGKVEIRPMMYIALSYDHRIIDGKSSVGFLVKIKELVEDPYRLLYQGQNPDDLLLGI